MANTKNETITRQESLDAEIQLAQQEAFASDQIGKRLVGRTVEMIRTDNFTNKVDIRSRMKLNNRKADRRSAELALNAELKAQGIDALASIRPNGPDAYRLQVEQVGDEPTSPVYARDARPILGVNMPPTFDPREKPEFVPNRGGK